MKRARKTKSITAVGGIVVEEEEIEPSDAEAGEEGEEEHVKNPRKKERKVLKGLSESELKEYNTAQANHGVVYLAKIPPRMGPQRVQLLMSQFGKVVHMYLRPESDEKRKRRKKESGMGDKRYTDGWVEFDKKSTARAVAASLNGTPIGGSRRCSYSQDLWVMKYLPNFTWDDLQEHLDREKENRHQRLQLAISRAKHENEVFLENVAASKRKRSREGKKQMQELHSQMSADGAAAGSEASKRKQMILKALQMKKQQ